MTNPAIEQIAEVCHELNRAYTRTIKDFTQADWHKAPDWQKKSAMDGVMFRLENRGATPEEMHVNWCNAKLRDGWAHGATKDPQAKTHPCLVEYVALPPEQRVKDALFAAVVDAFISVYGDDAPHAQPTPAPLVDESEGGTHD